VRITIITMLLLSFEISGATAYSSKSNLIGIWEPFEWQLGHGPGDRLKERLIKSGSASQGYILNRRW